MADKTILKSRQQLQAQLRELKSVQAGLPPHSIKMATVICLIQTLEWAIDGSGVSPMTCMRGMMVVDADQQDRSRNKPGPKPKKKPGAQILIFDPNKRRR